MMIKRIGNFLGYFSIFLFFLAFAIAFIINFTPLYSWDITYLGIEKVVGLSKDMLMENYRILLHYLNFPWVKELVMPNFPSSESGLLHFYEVKRLFMLDYAVLLISGVLSFAFIRKKKKEGRIWEMVGPLRIFAVLPLLLLFLLVMNFNRLFVTFHELFFNNDAWIFDWRTDPIILALPQEFFMHCFAGVFLMVEAGLCSLYFWAKKTAQQKRG